jgi:hypothetical protein
LRRSLEQAIDSATIEAVLNVRNALVSADAPIRRSAAKIAGDFNLEWAMADYARLIDELLQGSKPEGQHE